jgi:hypothetical protein
MALSSKASEPTPVYHRTPPTEEAKQQSPQPTQTKLQHISTFFYSYKDNTNQLHKSISSLENSPTMKCLCTSSRVAVVGVSCLEQVSSSLVDMHILYQ